MSPRKKPRARKRGSTVKSKPSVSASPKQRALSALALMRHGKSLNRAAKLAHTSPATIKKYAGTAVRRQPRGVYTPRLSDHIDRPMRFLTPSGVTAITVRDSHSASLIGKYWNAVDRFLVTGQRDALNRFRGERVRVGKRTYPFVTDPLVLERLANAGEVRFEAIYKITR